MPTRKRTKRGFEDPTAMIREAIVEGHFLPNERLVEQDLVPRFEANRSAVRLALARLEQEGLIIREPNRGARVRLVSGKEAIEIMETRSMLESLIARHAAVKITDDALAQLRKLLEHLHRLIEEGDLIGYAEENRQLHARIVTIGDHPTAAKLLLGLSAQSVISQFRPFLEPGRPEDLWHEHQALVEALASRDPDCVEHLMRAHLDKATQVIHTRLQRLEKGPSNTRDVSLTDAPLQTSPKRRSIKAS